MALNLDEFLNGRNFMGMSAGNSPALSMNNSTALSSNSTNTPSQVNIDPNRKFETGIPGFDNLSTTASQNVGNLLSGTESPDITRNINASWGAGSGLNPDSGYVRNRAIDLYGERGAARKQQGFQDLLAMLQGYSGTVTARPGDILGQENLNANLANNFNINQNDLASRERLAQEELARRDRELAMREKEMNLNNIFRERQYADSRPPKGMADGRYLLDSSGNWQPWSARLANASTI